ncbi:MAG: Hsp70 family protein, partial [Firmicutes bacterium]|nr:Hsp70 family protein [Bacillota bacterium]
KERKEATEARNQAESLIYETDKNLKDLEGKLSEDEKNKIMTARNELESAMNAGTASEIKAKIDALTEQYHTISAKLYEQAAGQAGQQGAGPQGFDPNNMGGAGFNPGAGFGGAGFNPGAGFGGQGGFNQNAGGKSSGPKGDDVVDADFEVVDDK